MVGLKESDFGFRYNSDFSENDFDTILIECKDAEERNQTVKEILDAIRVKKELEEWYHMHENCHGATHLLNYTFNHVKTKLAEILHKDI